MLNAPLDFTVDCGSREAISKSFDFIASKLFNDITLQVNRCYYRFVDIEFYYYAKGIHDDVYAHQHEEQLQEGKWYFHGSGIDITIGNGINHGGILLRGIGKVSPEGGNERNFIEKEIQGPLNVKTEVCSNLYGVFDERQNTFRLHDVSADRQPSLMRMPEHIIKTQRIGLNPSIDNEGSFCSAKYRYVIFPFLKLKNKTQIAKDMLEQYPSLGKEGVNKHLGSTFIK